MEIVDQRIPANGFRVAVFDFDGTLSLLRRNWHEVMIPMMVKILAEHSHETETQLTAIVESFVMRLNGRQTIYQMLQLCEEVRARGGQPLDPLDYKRQYHDQLWAQVSHRIDEIQKRKAFLETYTVPGARAFLQRLRDDGVILYLASGTDLDYVRNELRVLELDSFFEPRVYGALDDYQNFSKAQVIATALAETGAAPEQLFGCGDGFVEIEEVRKAGGFAIGVASNETTREGLNEWKRKRLLGAGADAIVGDYRDIPALEQLLGLTQ